MNAQLSSVETSDGAMPVGSVNGVANLPTDVWKAMVTLLSSALAAIRSSRPFPVKSAAIRLVGSAVVENAVLRVTPPLALIS